MATFVIVHGAWGGGWEWEAVARHLRGAGHDVFTPTLTGLGDLAHVGENDVIDLSAHVADVERCIETSELRDVVLCAASYGGMAVTGAAARVAERVRQLVYIDALVPDAGQAALDLLPSRFGEAVRAGLEEFGAAWRVPLPDDLRDALVPEGSLPDDVRRDYLARLTPHPAATFVTPLPSSTAVPLPRAFVRCVGSTLGRDYDADPIAPIAARARAEGWPYRELAAPHDPQLYDPLATAYVLAELAG